MSRGYVREGRRTSRAAGIFGVWLAPTHVWAGLATPVQFIGPAGMALDFLVGACAVAAVLLSPRPAAPLHETQALGPHEGLRPARDALGSGPFAGRWERSRRTMSRAHRHSARHPIFVFPGWPRLPQASDLTASKGPSPDRLKGDRRKHPVRVSRIDLTLPGHESVRFPDRSAARRGLRE